MIRVRRCSAPPAARCDTSGSRSSWTKRSECHPRPLEGETLGAQLAVDGGVRLSKRSRFANATCSICSRWATPTRRSARRHQPVELSAARSNCAPRATMVGTRRSAAGSSESASGTAAVAARLGGYKSKLAGSHRPYAKYSCGLTSEGTATGLRADVTASRPDKVTAYRDFNARPVDRPGPSSRRSRSHGGGDGHDRVGSCG
jgi:hypothetical protein